MRSLLPLPSTRRVLRSGSRSSTSRPASSPTRMPVAYSSSTMARSRSGRGPPSAAADSAPSTSGDLLLMQHSGQGLLPLRRLQPQGGVRSISSSRMAQAVNDLAVAERRASVARDIPPSLCGAEPPPQGAKFQPGEVVHPFGSRKLKEASDVGEVGAHRVGRTPAFRLQVAAETLGRLSQGGGDLRCGHPLTLAGIARRSRSPTASRGSGPARALAPPPRPPAGGRSACRAGPLPAAAVRLGQTQQPEPAQARADGIRG